MDRSLLKVIFLNPVCTFSCNVSPPCKPATLHRQTNLIKGPRSLEFQVYLWVSRRELDISGNLLTAVGPGVAQMPALQVLLIDHNQLEALPDEIAACPVLAKLDVSNNLLKSLPLGMGAMKKLIRLNCSNNFLETVPHGLGNLPIKELDLRCSALASPTSHSQKPRWHFLKEQIARKSTLRGDDRLEQYCWICLVKK